MDPRPFHRFDHAQDPRFQPAIHPDYHHRNLERQRLDEPELETQDFSIVVDSSQRDVASFPDSNRYRVYLRVPLTNVLSCRLASAEIPNVAYTVTEANQRFDFTELVSGTFHDVSFLIPTGHYDGTTLCTEIQRLMNAFTNSPARLTAAPYEVVLNTDRNKAVFTLVDNTHVSRFRIHFGEGTVHRVLGFDERTTIWNTDPMPPGSGVDPADPLYAQSIASDRYVDTAGDTYVYVCSPELNSGFHEVVYSKDVAGSDALLSRTPPHAFARVSLVGPPGSVVFYNENAGNMIAKRFVPPVAKVSSLEFEFVRADGTRVDFKNLENSMTIVFTCVSRSLGMPRFAGHMTS